MSVTFEVNPDQWLIVREGYTALDMFADIGGLNGIAVAIMIYFVGILNMNELESYMVSKLFRAEKKDKEED